MSKSNSVKNEPAHQTKERQSTNEPPKRSEPVRRPASSVVRKDWQDNIQNNKGQQDYFKSRLLRLALRADELAADGSQASGFRKTDNEDVFRQEGSTVENDIKTFIKQIPIEEQYHVLNLYRDIYGGLSALLSQWLINNMGGFLDANSSYAEAIYGWVVDFSGTLRKYVESQPTKDAGTNTDLVSTKTEKTKQNVSPAINIQNSNVILGDVHHPEHLQMGDDARIGKHEKTEEKKKGIILRILKIIGAITAFIAGLLTILHLLGWLEPIKEFVVGMIWYK